MLTDSVALLPANGLEDLYASTVARLNRASEKESASRGTEEMGIQCYLHLSRRFYSRLARFRRKQCASNDSAEEKKESEKKSWNKAVAYTFQAFSPGNASSNAFRSRRWTTVLGGDIESDEHRRNSIYSFEYCIYLRQIFSYNS